MLAKMTSKNQITIPKKIIEQLPDVEYFEVELNDGVVMLRPLKVYDTSLEKIRAKVRKLGLHENTVKEAIKWARQSSCRYQCSCFRVAIRRETWKIDTVVATG